MKKRILSIALIAMSLVSFTGFAQNNGSDENVVKKENVKGIKGNKDKKGDKSHREDSGRKDKKMCADKKGARMNKMKKVDPFQGMTLSETQRQQLDQLNAQRKAARKEMKMARKEAKQRNDSVKMEERRADRKSYLEQVKSIVGPEQYVVFLENVYVNGNGGNNHKAMVKNGHRDGKKDFAKGRHGEKGSRNMDSKKS